MCIILVLPTQIKKDAHEASFVNKLNIRIALIADPVGFAQPAFQLGIQI